jgi:predicted AlkP superfamily pyrophosphatase or phosphodiesterase
VENVHLPPNNFKNEENIFCLLSIMQCCCHCSKKGTTTTVTTTTKPKLVIGIVVDQMRWDYLYRFSNIFKSNGGFKRLMNEGFSCDNTFIPYTPTVTAAGHTCVYTGSVPEFMALRAMLGTIKI